MTDEELLRRRARDLARPLDDAADLGATRQIMRFRLAGDGYAVPLDRTRQVVPLAGVARLPRAAWPLVGLTSVAGHIVPIVMTARSTASQGLPAGTPWGVAVEARGTIVCFPADVVTDVVDLRDADVSADVAGDGDGDGLSRGLTREGDILIDVDALVASVEGRKADRAGAAPQDDVRDQG